MKFVRLIYCIVIPSLSYSNILSSSIFQLDAKLNSPIDSIIKYKQTYPKKALEFGFDSKEKLAVIILTQVRDENYDLKFHEKIRALIYQSII